ncbi:MAG: serine/threonine-protein kinase [Betaproteobacteria bacterium]
MSEPEPPTRPRAELTTAEFDLIEAVFAEIVDLDAAARARVIAARCAGRSDLQRELETLIAAHDRLHSLEPPPGAGGDVATEGPTGLQAGSLVGHYRLREKAGHGGMGDVYLAERADGLFTHRVAVKVTRAAISGSETAARFRTERQILASLQHPNIVTLLDGGVTSGGQAFLVMEYVDGVPLTRFCRERMLPLKARLRLLLEVCGAVQHAHRHAVVHRDLKPANILVTSEGVVKILDFGVAKLLEQPGAAGLTAPGLIPGPLTPNYASPEQLRGLPVTTATDVYALGILIYEILAGVRPYDTEGETLDRVIEIVLRMEPARPSAASAGGGRDAQLPYSRRRLRGDLDAIILKAMRKEPDQRYGSAGELADDLRRFLTGQAVIARTPSLGYVLRRLAVRNKVVTGVAAASIVVILSMAAVALWQRDTALRQEALAQARFRQVRQLANTLIFKIHDAVATLPGSTPVRRTIVSEALSYLEQLEADANGDDSLRLDLSGAYQQIGGILGDPERANLGDRAGALKYYQRARALVLPMARRRDAPFAATASLVHVDNLLVSLVLQMHDEKRALDFAREAVEAADRAAGRARPDPGARGLLARAVFSLAFVSPPGPAVVPIWRRALALFEAERAGKPADPSRIRNVALVEKYFAGALERVSQSESDAHYSRALQLDERRYEAAPGDRVVQFDLAIDLGNMAMIRERENQFDEAYALYDRSLELRRALAASDPQDVLSRSRVAYAHMQLARVELNRGRLASARAHVLEGIRIENNLLKSGDVDPQRQLGDAFRTLGRIDAAEAKTAAACAAYRRALTFLKAAASSRDVSGRKDQLDEVTAAVAACDPQPAHR